MNVLRLNVFNHRSQKQIEVTQNLVDRDEVNYAKKSLRRKIIIFLALKPDNIEPVRYSSQHRLASAFNLLQSL